MNISFLNPLLLLGLAATALPVLIHRITQKKTVTRKFPAVHLLVQSQLVTARPRRLKHLLLMALRILVLATLVFMMARPVLSRPGLPALHREGARVLILDNSLSMGYREDRGLRFDRAKKAALEATADFNGLIALVPTVGAGELHTLEWLKPHEAVKRVAATPLFPARGDAGAALALAYRQLQQLEMPKEILVLSDMGRNEWEGLDLTGGGTISAAGVNFIRIGGPDRDANLNIDEVRLEGDGVVAGAPARLHVAVSNRSDRDAAALIKVFLNGSAADQKILSLHSGRSDEALFELPVDGSGRVEGEVRLAPDRLAADDAFPFSFTAHAKIKVLIVDGDEKTSLRAGESYYLARALSPGGLENNPFLTQIISESEMGHADTRAYDCLFLLNVAAPDFSVPGKFLDAGKPVFLFLGDRVIPERYNKFSLMPWQVREAVFPGGRGGEAIQIDTDAAMPEFLMPFGNNLRKAVIYNYFKIEGGAKNLLTLQNRLPLLLASDVGKSRLFLFASSADLDWNDLPLNAGYLPLIQALVKEGLGLREKALPVQNNPAGPIENGKPPGIASPPGRSGIFQFLPAEGNLWRGVNSLADESDLAKISDRELKKKFGAIRANVVEYEEGIFKDLHGGEEELWPGLFVILLAFLLLETIYANGMPPYKG